VYWPLWNESFDALMTQWFVTNDIKHKI